MGNDELGRTTGIEQARIEKWQARDGPEKRVFGPERAASGHGFASANSATDETPTGGRPMSTENTRESTAGESTAADESPGGSHEGDAATDSQADGSAAGSLATDETPIAAAVADVETIDWRTSRPHVGAALGCLATVAVMVAAFEPRTALVAGTQGPAIVLAACFAGLVAVTVIRPRLSNPLGLGAMEGVTMALLAVSAFAVLAYPFGRGFLPQLATYVLFGLTIVCCLYPLYKGAHPFLGLLPAAGPVVGTGLGIAVVDLAGGEGLSRVASGAEAFVPVTLLLAVVSIWIGVVLTYYEGMGSAREKV